MVQHKENPDRDELGRTSFGPRGRAREKGATEKCAGREEREREGTGRKVRELGRAFFLPFWRRWREREGEAARWAVKGGGEGGKSLAERAGKPKAVGDRRGGRGEGRGRAASLEVGREREGYGAVCRVE